MADYFYVVVDTDNHVNTYTNVIYNVTDPVSARVQILDEAAAELNTSNVEVLTTIDNIDAAEVDQNYSGQMIVICEINGARDSRGIQHVNESTRANAIATAVNNIKSIGGLANARVGVVHVIGDEGGA